MASLDTGGGDSGHKKGPGVKKAKKLSTRVDMTPMVDLGFLLITFFIFTSTMSTPTTLDLFMPKDTDKKEEQNKAKESGALTILMGAKDNVFYYEGQLAPDASNFKTTNFKGIRDVIINKKKTTPADDLVIVIKPNEEATYKNTVDMLDEMTINEVKRFAMVDIFPDENKLIHATQGTPMPAETPAAAPAPAQ
ncbi:biopolymer transporter ExbD [Paraflavisolibacter sp. H34]|uniref:ExbD/TolR family protein n=1 Tax=Huijunlia imazamoxiresistens TaxID=3127457 RepID=UPI003019FEFB